MVPAAFVVLDSLPLPPNGKLDTQALPAPEITGEGEYRVPVTELEQLVASLFAELTGATRLGLDDMLNLFQSKWEELGMIPVGTPKSYVLGVLKNSVQSSNLTINHTPKKCHANIIYFRATEISDQNTLSDDLFNWQPYTDQTVHHYEVPVSHAQMLWQPVSYKLIAGKVHEIMVAHKQK